MPGWASLIRDVPDFPKPGVMFKDITPLLADGPGFTACLEALAAPWRDARLDLVCGTEARGFIFAGALAALLGIGFVPLRKPGKLPAEVASIAYELEYGTDHLEVHRDAFAHHPRALIVDDVLATGGTLAAARKLVETAGGQVAGAAVVLELTALPGRERWGADPPLVALLSY